MEENKNVTIYDIPERLNWATSTISRALKGHHTFSDKTIKKVKKQLKKWALFLILWRRVYVGNKTKTIGVFNPNSYTAFLIFFD
ncbi:hypothetical protein [Flavobacterium sp. FlaQc-48]|uniref:hypothetical protein n=1 Tax=Flavobacterium sp. FlaQc-48 TaxID=3374181 RepID=UPI00375814A9